MEQNTVDQPIIEKKKKGRPRKEVKVSEKSVEHGNNIENGGDASIGNVVVEKKKRGRKKKLVVEEEIKPKKKRGRKAAVKFFSSSIRKKIPLTTVIQDNNNYILHIPDLEEEQTNINMTYNPLDQEELDNNSNLIDAVLSNLSIDDTSNLNAKLEDDFDFINYEDEDLKKLYEKRIEYREEQDKLLFSKLESLHSDETFISNLVAENTINTDNSEDKQKILEHDIINSDRKKGYFSLMYEFMEKDWPEKTDICCWWCCHVFETIPLGMPIHYEHSVKKYRTRGIFCSFSCMKSYHDENRLKYYPLIMSLYSQITGEFNLKNCKINNAPPRCALKMFGGQLTISEFRKATSEFKIYKMIEYPMCISRDYVEEIDLMNVKTVNMKVFKDNSKLINLDSDRIAEAKLRLSEIEKSTISFGNTIDKFIKIS